MSKLKVAVSVTRNDVMSNATKVVVDQRAGSNLLFLPLDRLMASVGASGAAVTPPDPASAGRPAGETGGTPSPAPTPQAAEGGARSREALRSREREQRQ